MHGIFTLGWIQLKHILRVCWLILMPHKNEWKWMEACKTRGIHPKLYKLYIMLLIKWPVVVLLEFVVIQLYYIGFWSCSIMGLHDLYMGVLQKHEDMHDRWIQGCKQMSVVDTCAEPGGRRRTVSSFLWIRKEIRWWGKKYLVYHWLVSLLSWYS